METNNYNLTWIRVTTMGYDIFISKIPRIGTPTGPRPRWINAIRGNLESDW